MTQTKSAASIQQQPYTGVKPVKPLRIEDELLKAQERVRQLEAERELQDLARKEAEKKAQEESLKLEFASKIFEFAEQNGLMSKQAKAEPVPTAINEEVQTTENELPEVSTSKGVLVKLGLFFILISYFAFYQVFFGDTMNDSSRRIFEAMEAHLWTHIAISLATILFGFAVMYLMFPRQFKYFHNQISTQYSWNSDFENPTFEGVVRMATTFLAWLVPTAICASIMQLILG
jgi:hypothetical protein